MDAGELAFSKELRHIVSHARHEEGVGELLFQGKLRGIGDADRLGVDADIERVRAHLCHPAGKGALAAAEVELYLAEAPKSALVERMAGFCPSAGIFPGLGLDCVGISSKPLLEHEVLGHAGMDLVKLVHGTPCLERDFPSAC